MFQAIRRGTWLGLQLQLVWALLLGLGAVKLRGYLSSAWGEHSFAAQAGMGCLLLLACALLLATLLWRPWSLPLPLSAKQVCS